MLFGIRRFIPSVNSIITFLQDKPLTAICSGVVYSERNCKVYRFWKKKSEYKEKQVSFRLENIDFSGWYVLKGEAIKSAAIYTQPIRFYCYN